MKTKFNPAPFVHTAKQTWDLKLQYDKFLAENSHLAAPFHIRGLEDILPWRLPGVSTVHFAKSHHGKSTALRNDKFKAQERIEDTDFLIGDVSLEDTAEANAAKIVQRYGGDPMKYMDDSVVFIGKAFGMDVRDMNSFSIDNTIKCLEYGLEMLPDKKGYSHIFYDYAQVFKDVEELPQERRIQIKYIVEQIANSAVRFKCPVDFAAQALLKNQQGQYTSMMKIPGASDLKEAGELYEIPDVAIAYWQPKHEPNTPIGTHIDDGAWSFDVERNLFFIRIAKWRNAELMGFVGEKDIIGRVFPCFISDNGEMYYSAERHRKMQLKAMPE